MNEQLERKLASLREKYTDVESRGWIGNVETEITKLIEEKRLVDHPVFAAICDEAQRKLNNINALLMNDESLTDTVRQSLFDQKKVWKFVFEKFGFKMHDGALELLEKVVDDKLNQ